MSDALVLCVVCGATRAVTSTTRPPRGWKRIGDALHCGACLAGAYVIRAITVPIAGPVDATWAELGVALRAAWAETTRCANWIATELYARDVRREADETTLRPMPRVYLYPEARALFPTISPINLTALIQQVEQTYRRRRYELLWQRSVSLPTYRYPVPTPIHGQAWRLERQEGGAILAHVRLGDRWWALRLRGGQDFARQRADLLSLLDGTALPAAGALYQVAASEGDHRHAERGARVLLKLVARFPRRPRVASTTVCAIATSASDLLVLRMHGRGIVQTISGDQIRRGIRAYTVRRERIAHDLSIVRRMVPSERAGMLARLARMAQTNRDQLRTWCQQTAALAVQIARRQGAGAVVYEDETQDFCTPFPWVRLRMALAQACAAAGLGWTYASGATGPESPSPLAEEERREVSA